MTIPWGIPQKIVENFVAKKSEWIKSKVEYFRKTKKVILKRNSRVDFLKYKKQALALAEDRLAHFNKSYGYSWNKITIKNQKTRWGSCSKRGNLNFNYKIALLPGKMADYIIVHELCHLGAFNHSQKFWNLVAREIPDYREIRRSLRKEGMKSLG